MLASLAVSSTAEGWQLSRATVALCGIRRLAPAPATFWRRPHSRTLAPEGSPDSPSRGPQPARGPLTGANPASSALRRTCGPWRRRGPQVPCPGSGADAPTQWAAPPPIEHGPRKPRGPGQARAESPRPMAPAVNRALANYIFSAAAGELQGSPKIKLIIYL